jgi:hypothetical protein
MLHSPDPDRNRIRRARASTEPWQVHYPVRGCPRALPWGDVPGTLHATSGGTNYPERTGLLATWLHEAETSAVNSPNLIDIYFG